MKRTKYAWFFVFTIMANTSWAYGAVAAAQKRAISPSLPILFPLRMPKLLQVQHFLLPRLKTPIQIPLKLR